MINFPIPQNMMDKVRSYGKNKMWKRCRKCEYVTPTELLRCPCCRHIFCKRIIK